MPTAITLRAVTKAYQRGGQTLRVLDELDLTMDGATFYALMGPSGSGKTTLLNLVGGLDQADSGLVQVGAALQMRLPAGSFRIRAVQDAQELLVSLPLVGGIAQVAIDYAFVASGK